MSPSNTITKTQTPQPNSPTPTATITQTIIPVATIDESTVLIYPQPYNPETDLYVLAGMAQNAANVTIKVYTDSFRLIRVVQIRGPVSGPMTVDRAYFRDASMGTYYFIISAEMPGGGIKKSRIQNLIILK